MPFSSTSSSSCSSVEGPTASNGVDRSNGTEAGRAQKERLLNLLKKEVKHIMEESVMLKAICEDSATVTALCAVVDQCLSLGLRRRALGLFKTNSTTALLQKVSKESLEAGQVLRKVAVLEQEGQQRRTLSSGDSGPKLGRLLEKTSSASNLTSSVRFLWIRVALFDKTLHLIVHHLVQHADKYYTKESLLLDRDFGPLVSSLLAGPCALEFTKLRHNANLMWSDLPANELVERHRIASGSLTPSPLSHAAFPRLSSSTTCISSEENNMSQQLSPIKGPIPVKRSLSHVVAANHVEEQRSVSTGAREYVESLHQNTKDAIVYGKNNVEVYDSQGYLSIHYGDENNGLVLKWTPNLVMSGASLQDKNAGWQRAFSVQLEDVICMHCRKDGEDGCGYLGLISHDGTQHPPLRLPAGNHLMALLSCLEGALVDANELVIVPPVDAFGNHGNADITNSRNAKGTNKESKKRRILPMLKRHNEITDSKDDPNVADDKVEHDAPSDASNASNASLDMVFRLVPLASPSSAPPTASTRSALSSTHSLPTPKSPRRDWFASLRVFSPSKSRNKSADHAMDEQKKEESSVSSTTDMSELSEMSMSAPITELCHTMRRQLISRAFYGWLHHCRHMGRVRLHLSDLAFPRPIQNIKSGWREGVTPKWWHNCLKMLDKDMDEEQRSEAVKNTEEELFPRVYYGGVEPTIRKEVWPFLLGHQKLNRSRPSECDAADRRALELYENKLSDWTAVEAIVRQRDRETTAANIANAANNNNEEEENQSNDVFDPISSRTVSADKISTITEMTETSSSERGRGKLLSTQSEPADPTKASDEGVDMAHGTNTHDASSLDNGLPRHCCTEMLDLRADMCSTRVKVTTPSVDSGHPETNSAQGDDEQAGDHEQHVRELQQLNQEIASLGVRLENELMVPAKCMDESLMDNCNAFNSANTSNCYSPASSEGGSFPQELIDNFALNLHRIDKDVQRCDRNLAYFTDANLEKLRNIITTYVWDNLDVGYMQGMCDLVAPILVTLDDEAMAYACFCNLMQRMLDNFPTGTQMDTNFVHMRALIEVLDRTLYEAVISNAEFSQFYFCYRWFLLDFKREFAYSDVFRVWETIWSSRRVASSHFHLFVALALVEKYRDIILDRRMDFTDIIKFFNEMAEKHAAKDVLQIARDLVLRLQVMICETSQ